MLLVGKGRSIAEALSESTDAAAIDFEVLADRTVLVPAGFD